MPRLYLGEQLDRIMLKGSSTEEVVDSGTSIESADIFSKVASKLGCQEDETEGVDFGDSFVEFAEMDTLSDDAVKVAESLESIVDAIKVGRITSIDENLRNLFSNIDDDEDLASSIQIREMLQSIQGPEA